MMRRLTAIPAALLLGAAAALTVTAAPAGAAVAPAIRVNQVGYPADQQKLAYLLATTAQAGASWTVLAANGSTAASGTVGTSRGGWNAGYTAVLPIDFSSVTAPGDYRIRVGGTESPAFKIAPKAELYAPVAGLMTTFFQVQRDGANVIPGALDRQPSHLTDTAASVYDVPTMPGADDGDDTVSGTLSRIGGVDPVDVSGGWFDAADYLKFTHTTAYAVANLLVAQRSGSADSARAAEIDHAIGWLDKMWDENTGVLYAQVGIGGGDSTATFAGDHWVWRLPEADDNAAGEAGEDQYYLKNRPVFRANAPGATISPNLAGRVSAAFALAAQNRAGSDPTRARQLLDTAAAIFDRAKTTGVTKLVTSYPWGYYPEETWQDDLAFGATELARAGRALHDSRAGGWLTKAATWADAYLDREYRDTLNLYDVGGLALPDLAEAITTAGATGLAVTRDQLLAAQKAQLDQAVATADADRFRAGVDYAEYDATSHALGLIAQAARYDAVAGGSTYAAFAQTQASWVLGGNPWGSSMIIGTGTTFPKCPHHQVANLAGSLTGTGAILTGAAVNGPNGEEVFDDLEEGSARPCPADGTDTYAAFNGNGARFLDDVDAWMSVEPAIDFTSTGLLAFALLGAGGTGPSFEPDRIGVHRPANSTAYLKNAFEGGNADLPGFVVGQSGDVPLVGDWDGDGADGLGYWRPSTRTVWLRNSLTAGAADHSYTASWATSSDVPLVGDWNGDGVDTVATWRPGDRTARIRNTNTDGATESSIQVGDAPTDVVLAGDWDGDGRDTLAYYKPSTRAFHLTTPSPFVYGGNGDRPLVGDWNGDGRDTIGVFRPTGHQWHLKNTLASGTADISFRYGQDTDRPLVGHWTADGTPAEIAAAGGFYPDPDFSATRWLASNPNHASAATIRSNLAGKAGAAWFGNWSGDIEPAVDTYVSAATAAGQVPILVAYNVPGRDCGGESSGGAGSPAAYREWIDDFAAGVDGRAAIVIVEPDSVALIDCLSAAERTTRFGLVDYAVNAFEGQTWTYVDGGNSGWIDADTMASRLVQAGIANARGFAVNVSNFFTTAQSTTYADAVNAGLTSRGGAAKPYVIDTSRNGNGGTAGDWCNPVGAKLGATSRISTPGPEFQLWIKVPGDSDGNCGRIDEDHEDWGVDLPAGTFHPRLATNLINGT